MIGIIPYLQIFLSKKKEHTKLTSALERIFFTLPGRLRIKDGVTVPEVEPEAEPETKFELESVESRRSPNFLKRSFEVADNFRTTGRWPKPNVSGIIMYSLLGSSWPSLVGVATKSVFENGCIVAITVVL